MVERGARVSAPAALTLFAVVAALSSDGGAASWVVAAAVAALAVAVAWRVLRGWPLVVAAVLALAGFAVLGGATPANVGWFGVCVLAGWCAFLAPVVPALTFWAVATVVLGSQVFLGDDDAGWAPWIAGTLFTTVACLLAQHQGVLLARLGEAQAGLADRARAEERTRVAREMHDVIGHALTVTLLHIASARLAVDDEPDVARASLEEAERQARRSLAEIRTSVGLLREDGAVADGRLPLPGGGDLDALVESFRRTGAPVTCAVVGDPAGLAPGPGLAAYRILQEALTNAARHAPGAPTEVRVEVAADRTRVVVDSAGAPGTRTPAGTGLAGMLERAEAVGGRVDAGPAGHGWRVEAVLPT